MPIDPGSILVADASVVINLNATDRARDIIRAFPGKFVVTSMAFQELLAGARKGHEDARKLQTLLDSGEMRTVQLGERANEVYASLVEGAAGRTLDDGEAATIGHACECGGTALIDERKARGICAARFPALHVVSTVELLLHERIVFALGRQGQIDAIFNALQRARMRVPQEHLKRVVGLIGNERAVSCSSLPKSWMK